MSVLIDALAASDPDLLDEYCRTLGLIESRDLGAASPRPRMQE